MLEKLSNKITINAGNKFKENIFSFINKPSDLKYRNIISKIIKYPIANRFVPSMKLVPFTNIKIQKEVNKIAKK